MMSNSSHFANPKTVNPVNTGGGLWLSVVDFISVELRKCPFFTECVHSIRFVINSQTHVYDEFLDIVRMLGLRKGVFMFSFFNFPFLRV